MLQIMSILFGLVTVSSGPMTSAQAITLQNWIPAVDDRFIADTQMNQGYIVHTNGAYTTFPIGSGKEENVRYAGLRYNAATPDEKWIVKSTTIQKDRATFGKSGLFLRLYYNNGTTESHYGIHATGNITDILSDEDRYRSMGCVLVSNDILEILAQTYLLNGKKLEVVTTHGLPQEENKSLLAKSL